MCLQPQRWEEEEGGLEIQDPGSSSGSETSNVSKKLCLNKQQKQPGVVVHT